MAGHHLIMGQLTDFLSGEILLDTHDERLRQKIARFLVAEKGFAKGDIHARQPLIVAAGSRKGRLWVDFTVVVDGHTAMVVKYAPGSMVTRYRPSLAVSRLIAPYQVAVVVVTNGESADILDGLTGKLTASGLEGIPSRESLLARLARSNFASISPKQAEMEARILYAFEIDGSCPCDDSACRIE